MTQPPPAPPPAPDPPPSPAPADRALAPWWARAAIGAGLGTAAANAWPAGPWRSVSLVQAAVYVGSAFGFAAAAELSRSRFRPAVPLGAGGAVAAVVAWACYLDEPGLFFMAVPVFFGACVLAGAPPIGPGQSRLGRGGCRDVLVPLGVVAALAFSCLATAAIGPLLWEIRRLPGALQQQAAFALVGAGSTLALELASRIGRRAVPGR